MLGYNKVDQTIHQLSQTIAKANRTYVPKQADDSHTNLSFDILGKKLYGRWIKVDRGQVILALDIENFCFEVINDQRAVISSFDIAGKTQLEIEIGIEGYFSQLGLDPTGFRENLHFEITSYEFVDNAYQMPEKESLLLWYEYRSLAVVACDLLLGFEQVDGEVRIWPHHFDTGTYLEVTSEISLGFGLAMEDSMVGAPYFYFSGYGLNGNEIHYSKMAALSVGKWVITEHWKGAVLPLPELTENAYDKIAIYIKEVSALYLKG